MAATLYLAQSSDLLPASESPPSVTLDDSGGYWFLYRYFEGANLQRHQGELVDLYGERVIEGYQLTRFIQELKQAAEDVQGKPNQWDVLVGWNGHAAVETEIWRTVKRREVQEVITAILDLANAVSGSSRLVCSGD